MKQKEIRLYNVLFPVWFFYLMPSYLWLVILGGNFLIDSLVLLLSARRQGLAPKELWKKHILSIWGVGFLSDFLGAGLIWVIWMALAALNALLPGLPNLLLFPWTTLISIPGTILAGFLIYRLNREWTFRSSDLEEAQLHRLCLHPALFTAPYAMLIPIYG